MSSAGVSRAIPGLYGGLPIGTKAKPGAGRLAFSAFMGTKAGIFTIDPNGRSLRFVAEGTDPAWSPDGERIAFSRFSSANASEIFVMNADGSNIRRVIAHGVQPTWSPDGRRLAYACGGICVIDVDGENLEVLTGTRWTASTVSDACVQDSDPSWSPDGKTIAYTRWPPAGPYLNCLSLSLSLSFPFDFNTEVWLVQSDGSNARPLRDANGMSYGYSGWPAWSPTGDRLAFFNVGNDYDAIAVVDADGSNYRTAAHRSPPDWFEFLGGPDWSPDGQRLVVGTSQAFSVVSADGTTPALARINAYPSTWALWSWSRR